MLNLVYLTTTRSVSTLCKTASMIGYPKRGLRGVLHLHEVQRERPHQNRPGPCSNTSFRPHQVALVKLCRDWPIKASFCCLKCVQRRRWTETEGRGIPARATPAANPGEVAFRISRLEHFPFSFTSSPTYTPPPTHAEGTSLHFPICQFSTCDSSIQQQPWRSTRRCTQPHQPKTPVALLTSAYRTNLIIILYDRLFHANA